MTFNQHSAVTTHPNEPPDLRGYWTKVHQIFSRKIYGDSGRAS